MTYGHLELNVLNESEAPTTMPPCVCKHDFSTFRMVVVRLRPTPSNGFRTPVPVIVNGEFETVSIVFHLKVEGRRPIGTLFKEIDRVRGRDLIQIRHENDVVWSHACR